MDHGQSIKSESPLDFISGSDAANDQKRRSSSRSIKRKRFDDEIVEYSLGIPPTQMNRIGRSRTQSQSYITTFAEPTTPLVTPPISLQSSAPLALSSSQSVSPQQTITSTSVISVVPVPPKSVQPTVISSIIPQVAAISLPIEKRRNPKGSGIAGILSGGSIIGNSSKKSKKNRSGHQISTKDLGRWKPIDDLALIFGIQQTNDLRMVHRGTKFSCKFTVQEMQARWYSLLYEEPISRIAVAAMRNLHPELVENVQNKALYTTQEEDLLGSIKSTDNPTIEIFQDLLDKNASVFYSARTAQSLSTHWQLMKQYSLLPDQTVQALHVNDNLITFSDTEDMLNDAELIESKDDALDIELSLADRINKKEIRQLENELTRWTVLVDSLTGIGFTPEFDNQTLAVLRGRLVRYLMRSREITFGRTAKDETVDVDLTLEGPAHKVSRKQGTIKLRSNGDFFIANEGKRPLYIDGMPLLQGNKIRLNNNCVIEMTGLRFIFLINNELINAIRQESAKINGPLN